VRQLSKTLVRLNVDTRAFHAEADGPWLDLVVASRAPNRHDYIQHLISCYGFDAPLEAALAYTPHVSSFIDLHPRFRAGFIAEDLLNLGVPPSAIAGIEQAMIAPFASVAEALGWLYVHQRSTLLHETVRAELLERLPELAFATTYLRRNAGRIGIHWDELGAAMDKIARTEHIENRVIAAAIEASRAAVHWYRRHSELREAVSA
jgi:heme oxygenase